MIKININIFRKINLLNPNNKFNGRFFSTNNFRFELEKHNQTRRLNGLPDEILNVKQVNDLIEELKDPSELDTFFLADQFKNRILPGVDSTSRIKANFLLDLAEKKYRCPIFDQCDAVEMLGTMQGGYSIAALVKLLSTDLANQAANQLKTNILIFDYINDIEKLYQHGNPYAFQVLESWSNGEWFLNKKQLEEKITLQAFKVSGEINTDDLSPAVDAWSRPDIPFHALSMLKNDRSGIFPDKPGEIGPIQLINKMKQNPFPIAFIGDVVGTGSSRKSATNSILWHFGEDIPYVPNKRNGGYCFGSKIAPIFFNTMEDSGALPIEMPVDKIEMGQLIDIYPYQGITKDHYSQSEICRWSLQSNTILDSVRAKGRINLIIGKSLTSKAQNILNKKKNNIFISNDKILDHQKNGEKKFTLAQKMVGKACGLKGVSPGDYCQPIITSVGSQDTTGPMTRDELKDLACLGFSADLVMQSFCHTAAYPKPIDLVTHNTLPDFMHNRGGISLKPGDGIIHSWLNRMLLPDTVGTGGDSHTRFPIGISFPAGSGLVAFAAATGIMPLNMPESVLVRFKGDIQPGITLRDLVHAIPYIAKQKGLLTLDKKNKKNIFSGNILEIEGLPNLTCEQAFELSDASAERSSSGCTIKLDKQSVIDYLQSNISLLKWMIKQGYQDNSSIKRRIRKMEDWINNPQLLEADKGAKYKEIIEINLNQITEPILCAPNDPDHAVLLSEVSNQHIDEVFIGSCMTNIGHFRAAGKLLENNDKPLNTKLWMAPPTKMDQKQLEIEGFYDIYHKSGVRTEIPGCSLCMGNQARVADKSTVLSTSTRNFPNRLGKGANVYLASAELSAICAIEGKIPSKEIYLSYMKNINNMHNEIFNYLNFNQLEDYK